MLVDETGRYHDALLASEAKAHEDHAGEDGKEAEQLEDGEDLHPLERRVVLGVSPGRV